MLGRTEMPTRERIEGPAGDMIRLRHQSRLGVRKFSFSRRTINVWNKLSEECVHASSVNMFKNRTDKYLVKAG